jgi:hypothetical protein
LSSICDTRHLSFFGSLSFTFEADGHNKTFVTIVAQGSENDIEHPKSVLFIWYERYHSIRCTRTRGFWHGNRREYTHYIYEAFVEGNGRLEYELDTSCLRHSNRFYTWLLESLVSQTICLCARYASSQTYWMAWSHEDIN